MARNGHKWPLMSQFYFETEYKKNDMAIQNTFSQNLNP